VRYTPAYNTPSVLDEWIVLLMRWAARRLDFNRRVRYTTAHNTPYILDELIVFSMRRSSGGGWAACRLDFNRRVSVYLIYHSTEYSVYIG